MGIELEKARKRLLKAYMALSAQKHGPDKLKHRSDYHSFLEGAAFALQAMEKITLETTTLEFILWMKEEALRRFPDFEESFPKKKVDTDPYGMKKDD